MSNGVQLDKRFAQRVDGVVRHVEAEMPLKRAAGMGSRTRAGGAGTTLVKVTGNAAGGGKYTGFIWEAPTPTDPITPFPAAGNLIEAEIGQAGHEVLIANAAEAGQSTHDLTTGTPRIKIFPAHRLGRMSDDATPLPVYVITAIDMENCNP